MTTQEILKETVHRMEATLEDARRRFSALRTGRASVSLLDGIQVESYGTLMPLNQLATISAPEPALITVQPWDTSLLGAIERAIQSSDLGITPSNDGKIVRLPIPPLTEERRKQLARTVRDTAEEHRTGLRNIRRDANEDVKKLLKEKLVSEDEQKAVLDQIQKHTDAFTQKLNDLAKAKEEELMRV
ncbi:MAG: ribosome recycling factor [Chloracidobacterium sp.]|uniref:Ribosome-recycling factor n=2 Tax=Chloracidobacterium validum TaxID=2821543 RepID=A0ABX8B6D4_9BACT|nr:ribosome recycling factor [Chloracidobacterium validum]